MKIRRYLATLIAAIALPFGAATAAPTNALYLAMDGSGSISPGDFTTQVNSYVAALNNVFAANPSLYGKVAIGGGIFGGNFSQFFAVQAINNAGNLNALTAAIAALDPGRGGINTGATAIGTALTASANALIAYQTALGGNLNMVIDVTTDGQNNTGAAPGATAAALIAGGQIDAINCLGIGANATCAWSPGLQLTSPNFAQFQAALENKIKVEFNLVPEPGTLLLIGAGLFGLGFARRRSEA